MGREEDICDIDQPDFFLLPEASVKDFRVMGHGLFGVGFEVAC